jgi:hypothetical protein
MSNDLITYDLAQPAQSLQLASELKRFVKEQKLTVNIKGKEYPLVESWQWAGAQLGLYPQLNYISNHSTETEVKYLAEVSICKWGTNEVISKGVAICSNKEGNKRQWDEYAILSMAQTRATGKAFRNLISWLMKAAGFEATPAEEMDFSKPEPAQEGPTIDEKFILLNLIGHTDLSDNEAQLAVEAINGCNDYNTYQKLQHRLEARKKPIDQIVNPSQKDINKHLKKSVK